MTLSITLPKAWKMFVQTKYLLLLVLLLEVAFFGAVSWLHFHFFIPTTEAALKATDAMQKEFENAPSEDMHLLDETLEQNPEFMTNYLILVENIIYFMLGVLALWMLVRGPLWFLSHRAVDKKIPFLRTWAKFAGMTLFWAFVALLVLIAYSILQGSTETVLPLISSTTASALFVFVIVIITYFQQLSYAVLGDKTFKKTFAIGIKHWKSAVPVWLVSAMITFIAITLPLNWLQSYPQASLAVYALISIPALHFARINLITPWQNK